jgi:prepilin-type N-terminal cleavage/methylation domain-containing protein
MKTRIQNRPSRAFTLVEMVGVLAVIAILASMLTPKIFSAISDARLTSAVSSLDVLKAATAAYYSKNGSLPTSSTFDQLLITGEFLEKRFECKLGTGDMIQAVAGPAGFGNTGYKLDGTVNLMTAAGTTVVECLLSNVPVADAWELSKRVDGVEMSATSLATNDLVGRVLYNHTTGNGTVFIYLGHR